MSKYHYTCEIILDMELSYAEENYLKAIYHLSDGGNNSVNTNAIADVLNTKPASVSDMIRKLSAKEVVDYQKYQGVNVSEQGCQVALKVIRKHRLWEVFLVEKLGLNWDEVHDIAEQLEHIKSPLLIERLDAFLGFPKYDPHGDPIPDEKGILADKKRILLSDLREDSSGTIAAVRDSTPIFLQYLDKIGACIGTRLKVIEKIDFDGSMMISLEKNNKISISRQVAENLWITT
ncbi:MAG: metal-dependent transcriptional regulator [Cyclobacteriaceae bacterium]